MKKIFYLTIILFFTLRGLSTGGYITISSVVPSDITVCGQAKLFTFTINNPSAFNLTGVSVDLTMPSGLNYQIGSATNATVVAGPPTNTPTFSLANIPANTSVIVTFTAAANCDILNYLSLGLPTENQIQVNYTANSTICFDNHTTQVYIVKQPNVSITTVTNQSFNGSIGASFTRCISITNGGTGELSTFSLTDVHGNGITVTAATPGTWTSAAGTETYVLTGADFTSIGNGNALFETGESITICETVTINNCSSVFSSYEAAWGCNSQACQTSVSTANVVFPNFVPNLVITAQPSANVCLGVGNLSQQTLTIVNTGAGQAINTLLKIYQTSGPTYYDPSQQTEINVGSITIKVNSGAPSPLAATTASPCNNSPCLSAAPIGGVDLTIPTINPGDTVRISWNTQSCCQTGYGYYNGWAYSASYQSICLNNYVVPAAWGRVYNQNYINNLVNNGSPSTISSGQTSTFNYLLNGVYNSSPALPDAYLKVTFTVSPCYNYAPNTIKIVNSIGTATFMPSSVNQVGNIITAVFSGSAPFNATMYSSLEQSQLLIDLTGNCTSCVSGPGTIGVGIAYSPSAGCPCEMLLITSNFNLNLVCPVTCEGLNFRDYSIKRTSYGLPDNTDDGLPDATGTLDFTKIKTSRAMYGDTITSSFYGKIKTSVTHPTWQFCYASSTITNGNNLTAIGGKLKIYRGVGLPLIATCNIGGVAAVAPTATFKYDLSSTALIASGGVGAGFVFLDNDSLVFEPQYKVTTNIGGAIIPVAVTNTFVVSDIASPTNPANIYSCNTFDGNFSIIGYYYTNYGPDSYSLSNCDQISITQNYYLSIGPCCSNYAGGNLFPFEYRPWARIDTLELVPPTGYKYLSAQFVEVRTAGTFAGSASATFPIVPINPLGATLKFPVGSFYTSASTPSITPSDDGFYGVFTATLEPSCAVVQNVAQNIGYNWTFKPSAYLPQAVALNTSNVPNQDQITYSGPNIFLQSVLPNINATTNVVTWDISLSNISTPSAFNTWISAPTISGLTINTVVDLATSATITPVGGIYQLGTLAGGALKNYRLYGTYTSCLQDSIIVHAGWNCQGYPANLAAYPCITKKITLKETPQTPLLLTTVITPPTVVDLCDTASYEVIGTNVQLGSVYNLTVSVNVPLGVNIIPGSSQLAYPIASPYATISDPIYMGGTIYQYNISVLSPSIGLNGMPGILSVGDNAVKIKFKVLTSCGYTSGSLASFSFFGVSGCGGSTGQLVSLSSQLGITGASAPYLTNTVLKSTYISPCSNSSILHIFSENLGGLSFGNTDSLQVTLPAGVSYVAGSFSGIHNFPVNGIPAISFYNNQQHLTWKLLPGVTLSDSTVFDINYTGNPSVLSCNISNFEAKTTSSSALLCTLSGSLCGVNVITGGDTLPIFTYKSYLALSNASGYSIPNPPAGETAFVNFTINNTGEALNATNATVISYYNDVNSNGMYNAGDVLISQHTANIAIPNNGSYAYTYSLNIPSGAACHVIAVIDTAFNHCSCTPSQIPITLPLRNFATDTIICAGQTGSLGYNAITGYTYAWSPATDLNSSTISNPTITGVNNTLTQITNTYIVTANRNTCTSQDTAVVKINPLPIVATTGNTICVGSSAPISAAGATTYSWLPTASLNSPTGATVTANPITTTDYTVTGTDGNGCVNTATTNVLVNPLPVMTATSDTLCFGLTTTLVVSGANTYTWNPSGSLNTGIGSTVTASPTITTTYTITGTDVNNCVNTTTATALVNPLPIISATSNTLCIGDSVSLIASGADTYTWNPSATLNSANGASVTANPTITTGYTITGTDLNSCVNTTTTSVLVNPLPIVTATTNTLCIGLTASLTATGATTYTWNPFATLSSANGSSVTASPTITTSYSITGTDSNGCVNTTTTSVLVNPLPVVTATSNTICVGSSGQISAAGAITYTWSPAASLISANGASVTANPISTTVYNVVGTDLNGCVNSTTTTVNVNPLPVITTSPSFSMCSGNTGTLTAGGAATYTWTPALNLNSATGNTVTSTTSATETYTVTGTDLNTCVNSSITTITVVTTPTISVSSSSAIICPASSATLVATGATNYTWTPATTLSSGTGSTVIATPVNTETYVVTGANSNCIDITQIVVTVTVNPTITSTSHTICSTQSATLTASGASTYTWSPGTHLNTTTSASVISTPPTTQTYTVRGSSPLGCINSTSLTVDVIPTPTLAISSSTPIICAGNSTTLNASGASSFTWSPATVSNINTGTTIATPLATTIYTATGSNGLPVFGCTDTKTIQIIVTPLPIIITGPGPIICEGQSTLIYATGGTTYTWSPSAGVSDIHDSTTTVKPTGSGIIVYTVTGTTNNCSNTATVGITVNSLPILDAGVDSIINIDHIITLNGTGNTPVGFINASTGVKFDCNYCPTVTVNPQENTCYTLEGISSAGCRNTDVVCITVTKDWNVYIPNAFTPNGDEKNEVFVPMGFGIAEIKLTIFNRWGVEIFKSNGENIGWDGKNKGQLCEQGIYIYQAEVKAMSGQTVVKTGHVTLLSKVK
ncbi:MAG: gliding motility-associated C-terminal domain-containing protein [Bacteroidota bacterium]